MAVERWTEDEAAILDYVYMTRTAQLIRRTRSDAKAAADDLADHMARVAHDSNRAALEGLRRPYFARWRLLMDMLERCADRLELPDEILGRKHVKDILRRVAQAGGPLPQSDLEALIANPGQRSATLKLMETWDLIERVPGSGNSRFVIITDLGRVAIGEDVAGAAAERATAAANPFGQRFAELMCA
jgi:hypothetical protein